MRYQKKFIKNRNIVIIKPNASLYQKQNITYFTESFLNKVPKNDKVEYKKFFILHKNKNKKRKIKKLIKIVTRGI